MRTVRDEDEPGVAFENVKVKRASPKAMLCVIGDEEHWIPNSQVHEDSEVYVDSEQAIQGSPGKLVLKRWICEQKGLVSQ
jgi:hypothetical protein